VNEYEYEPVKGLPEALPEGEYIVWQGVPEWAAMAQRVFHVRAVTVYFALLMAWYVWSRLSTGSTLAEALSASSWPLALGASALGILWGMAWLFARASIYTLTNKRVVLRLGVAIPMMINLPLEQVESADVARYGEDFGDLSLTLTPGNKVSYMALWPHARPWHYGRVKPMLRGIHNPALVASLLADVVGAQPRPENRSDKARGMSGVVAGQPLAT
jgi:hypothetical protein